MIDLQILEEKGITVDALKALFTTDKPSEKTKNLIDHIRGRIQTGINFNLTNYKVYYALDLAWDTPFRQVTPTLLTSMVNKDPSNESVYKVMQDFGLTSQIHLRDVEDPKTGKKSKAIDVPAFFNVTVPLMRAYVTIRWAKIMNDRRLTPFFKYEPLKDTAKSRIKCEVITDRIQLMATDYGYYDVVREAVFHMLHYSFALQFPQEEWHEEKQLVRDADGKAVEKVEKEGLRYHIPHPTRCFWDQAHRLSTFNSDTGCSHAGYWRVFRYRDILDSDWWNKDKITIGQKDWFQFSPTFFTSVYSACTMQFPQSYLSGQEGGQLDRESVLAANVYTADIKDSAVTMTEYFEKLVPSEWGLGDYDYPVWFRFVVASDDTICYCAPIPYCPVVYYGYDAHEARAQNASLSLEVLPYQDQVSNLMTQLLISTKQNLANINFVDTDQVDESTIKELQGWGERMFRKLNFVKFSSKKWRAQQTRTTDAVQPLRFTQFNTREIIEAINVVLNILERVLVMSSQEVAQAASHEQTREEVRNIAGATSTRLAFTAAPVDQARDAMKRQLYAALMSYGNAEFYAQVSDEVQNDMSKEELEKMGLTVEEKSKRVGGNALMKTTGKDKTAIRLASFASTRDGDDRRNNSEAANAMAQFIGAVLGNPLLANAIGAEQGIRLMNEVARMAGFPRDFKLRNVTPEGAPETMEESEIAMQGDGAGKGAGAGQAAGGPEAMMAAQMSGAMGAMNMQTQQSLIEMTKVLMGGLEQLGATLQQGNQETQAGIMKSTESLAGILQPILQKILEGEQTQMQIAQGIAAVIQQIDNLANLAAASVVSQSQQPAYAPIPQETYPGGIPQEAPVMAEPAGIPIGA